jgi:hypothetical protein
VTARWTDDQFRNVRRVDRRASDAGLTPGTGHGSPAVARQSAADPPRSAGTHGGRVPPRPSTVPPRPLWGWLIVSFVLLLIGAVSCHHEADGSPFCAEKVCEVTP